MAFESLQEIAHDLSNRVGKLETEIIERRNAIIRINRVICRQHRLSKTDVIKEIEEILRLHHERINKIEG